MSVGVKYLLQSIFSACESTKSALSTGSLASRVAGLPYSGARTLSRAGHPVFGGPRSRKKRGFTKMALTWATGVRFGRVTSQNERENELYLAANTYGGLGHRPGRKNANFY
ncbi:hypothetical protein Hanom_Chr03g00244931 [Helianthus anomalus]